MSETVCHCLSQRDKQCGSTIGHDEYEPALLACVVLVKLKKHVQSHGHTQAVAHEFIKKAMQVPYRQRLAQRAGKLTAEG
jgi:5-methylcytosine-specific restriction endonuclease McrBC regulatory subunit McrC